MPERICEVQPLQSPQSSPPIQQPLVKLSLEHSLGGYSFRAVVADRSVINACVLQPSLLNCCRYMQRKSDYRTPLHLAVQRGLFEAARRLVELGADINAVAKVPVKPIIRAFGEQRNFVVPSEQLPIVMPLPHACDDLSSLVWLWVLARMPTAIPYRFRRPAQRAPCFCAGCQYR